MEIRTVEKRPRAGSAVLIKKGNTFLLAKRNKKNYNGKWVIPGGGIDWGETIEEAAVREIKEETNLDIKIIKLICFREIINLKGEYHSIVFFHLAEPIGGELRASDDSEEARFFSVDDIKKLDIAESVKEVLQEAGFWDGAERPSQAKGHGIYYN